MSIFVLVTLVVGLLSGLYPAFYLTGFNPLKLFKSDSTKAGNKNAVRNAAVVIQFAVSIIIIIGSLTAYKQIEFIRNKNLGFGLRLYSSDQGGVM